MEKMTENITTQLKMLGYEVKETDKAEINYLLGKHISQVMYICGIEEIQEPLSYVIVDKVCAELLKNKLAIGEDIEIDLDKAKSIKIGDVTVDFPSSSSNEEKLNLILSKLERNEFDYSPYSRMRW